MLQGGGILTNNKKGGSLRKAISVSLLLCANIANFKEAPFILMGFLFQNTIPFSHLAVVSHFVYVNMLM